MNKVTVHNISTLVDVEFAPEYTLKVERVEEVVGDEFNIFYQVCINGNIVHPRCTAEDTMRALGTYLQN